MMFVILIYDVNVKRVSRVRKTAEKYLQPIEGMLPSERIICEIEKLINS